MVRLTPLAADACSPDAPGRTVEALVVGGGPAGLSAALCLARYGRRVEVVDAAAGRSSFHQVTRNLLGFPGGIPARDLRMRGHQQLAEYPEATVRTGDAVQLTATDGGFLLRLDDGGAPSVLSAPAVVYAAGVADSFPHFPGWEAYVGRSLFWCIACDGYECRGKDLVVLGATTGAAREAVQLAALAGSVTLLTNTADPALDVTDLAGLAAAGVSVVGDVLAGVDGPPEALAAIRTGGGARLTAQALFSVQAVRPRTDVLGDLAGRVCTGAGYVGVDTEQRTAVPGLFAAGDVTALHSHAAATAIHEGAQAAAAAHAWLTERVGPPRRPGV